MLPSLTPWLAHFETNASDPDLVPWRTAERLAPEEYRCIKASIAKFQLGEYSEGRGLMKFAEAYAKADGSRHLVTITRYFIKEEQNHAFLLKRFMELQGIPVILKNWTDTVFRRLRKNVGYEMSITVLITAELIALVYYKALRACTQSRVLTAVCDKILRDETVHVRYESEVINFIHGGKGALRRWFTRFRHQFLYAGTVLVVYFDHVKVLKRGGYTLPRFWRACWAEHRAAFGAFPIASAVPAMGPGASPASAPVRA